MGNIIQVPVRFEFHFVNKDRHERVSTTLKIRRLRRLRDALKLGLDNCQIPEGGWRVCSFSASPLKLVDAFERVRCSGVLVVYAEPSNEVSGVDLSLLSSKITFDVRLNELQVSCYEISVPSNTIIINALGAFVQAHSCCSNDFEVRSIQRNGRLVSGCDRVQNNAVYTVELKANETSVPVEGNFTIHVSFVQDDENREISLDFPANSLVSNLKERLKFVKIDHVCFVDQQFGALAMVEDSTQLVPDAKYMIDAESAANQNLVEPLHEEFRKLTAKPDILTPATAGQSMILRRNAYGLQIQMGSLYDACSGKFTSVHFPVDILMNQLGRQKFGNVQLRSTVSPADPWTLVGKCGIWEGSVDCFGVKSNEELDTDRLFYYVYERKTGILSMDVEKKFYENIDIGTNTHVLNGAVMGVYFVISLYFEPSEVEFDREAVMKDLNEQLSVPCESERPPLSDLLTSLEPSILICLYAPELLNLATPFTLKGCRELIDNFKVNMGQEIQLEHWFLPLHQILPLERLKPTNILAYETAGA
ncbi:hypothetical protein M3Y97_01124600 [Aphelenchoides bicaudatus]|nr:hypothetical protein M3Y97_01124600 [Aphelenchoides bicaudatus]